MPVELVNPETLPKAEAYAQVGVATGSRTVYVSGQVARTADGAPVGKDDLAAQVEQAFSNLVAALTAVGADYTDVAKLTIYLVDWTPERWAPSSRGPGGSLSGWGSTRSGRRRCSAWPPCPSLICWSRSRRSPSCPDRLSGARAKPEQAAVRKASTPWGPPARGVD